jgi:hypothetical protein
MWAFLGVRNSHQSGKAWREVASENSEFCSKGVCYYPEAKYRNAASGIFDSFETPMSYFLSFTTGGAASLYRRSPFKAPLAWTFKRTRSVFLVTRKA